MNQPFKTARDVSEHLLEKTEQAILSYSIDGFLPCFCLPTEIQTFDGRRLIRTDEELRHLFLAVTKHYATIGVTDMVRHCVEASFTDPQTVVAMHETRLITGNVITRNPFPALSVLKFNGTVWQISSCSYAIEDQREHNAALMSAGQDHPADDGTALPFKRS
ncbi:MAG: hypothetical protein AAF999_18220 [Pseudomonadota bacterium]